MIRVIDLEDGQPIKALQTLYCVDTIHHDGFLLNDVTGLGEKEINLYLTGSQFLEDISKVAEKHQVGIWNEEFNRIDFKTNSGIDMFLVPEDIGILDDEIFELCSRLELHNWYVKNIDLYKDVKYEDTIKKDIEDAK